MMRTIMSLAVNGTGPERDLSISPLPLDYRPEQSTGEHYIVNPCDECLYMAWWERDFAEKSKIGVHTMTVVVKSLSEVSRVWKQPLKAEIQFSSLHHYVFNCSTAAFDDSGQKFGFLIQFAWCGQPGAGARDIFLLWNLLSGNWTAYHYNSAVDRKFFVKKSKSMGFAKSLNSFTILSCPSRVTGHRLAESLEISKIECDDETGTFKYVLVHHWDPPAVDSRLVACCTAGECACILYEKLLQWGSPQETVHIYDYQTAQLNTFPVLPFVEQTNRDFGRIPDYQVAVRILSKDRFSFFRLYWFGGFNRGCLETFFLKRYFDAPHFEMEKAEYGNLSIKNHPREVNVQNLKLLRHLIAQDPRTGTIHFAFSRTEDGVVLPKRRFHAQTVPLEPGRLKILAGKRVRGLCGPVAPGISLDEIAKKLGISPNMAELCFC